LALKYHNNPQSPIRNPQSAIPNPQSPIRNPQSRGPQSAIPNPQSPIRNPLLSAGILLACVWMSGGCAPRYEVTPTPPAIREIVQEIDTYRGDGVRRSLDHTFSQDASYRGVGDRVTTAGMQFKGPICRIQIADVLLTTLKNNRALRVEDYNRSIARDGIEAARGIYDLLVESSYKYSWGRSQTPMWNGKGTSEDDLVIGKQRRESIDLYLSQLVPSGGMFRAYGIYGNNKDYLNPSTKNPFPLDPYESFALGAGFVQPLLKGFDPWAPTYLTNAPIQMARIQEKIAAEGFRNQVITQMATAVQMYWDLVFAIDNYEVQHLSLERARELLRITKVKVDTGVEAPNVVLQAEAEVSRREALLIDAQRLIADSADRLKRAMGMTEGTAEWQYNLIPVERPSFTPMSPNEEAVYAEALEMRPEYRTAQFGLDMAEIDLKIAENAKKPELDASVGYQITGMGKDGGEALDSIQSGNYSGWNAGLTLKFPLQNRYALATYSQKTKVLAQGKESLESLKEMIRLEVRSAIRALETGQKLIAAYDANVKSEEAKLDAQVKRYNVGFATIFEVLTFQEDLATAQVSYLQSLVSYQKAIIELQRVKASFLQDYRVQFLDKPVQERAAREKAGK